MVGSQSQFPGSELPGPVSSLSQPRANAALVCASWPWAVGWGMLDCRRSWPICSYIFREIVAPFVLQKGLNPLTMNAKLSLTFTENRNIRNIFTNVTKYPFLKSVFIVNNIPVFHLGGKQYRYT